MQETRSQLPPGAKTPPLAWWTGGAILALLALVMIPIGLNTWRSQRQQTAVWTQVRPGDSETAVVELLGPPLKRYTQLDAPADYYISGYGRKERPITGAVLIYQQNDLVFYVWISPAGLVEETAWASS